jgi:predicted dinucleotide-utilizing enzyme
MRVGLVGAGFMGGVHLNAYADIPEVEVVGVADARVEAAVAGAKMVGARPYASYDELVVAEDVEVIDVCLPTAFHRDLAVRAAGEGKHVILEKPIARTMEDAQEILETFSELAPASSSAMLSVSSPSTLGSSRRSTPGSSGPSGWSAPAAAHLSYWAGTTGTPTGA